MLRYLVVLAVATVSGSRPAILAAVGCALCFNFFFLPPYNTLTIADPQNWVALSAFLVTAITVGWLSANVKRRAEESESGRREVARLYEELQASFAQASQAEALRQSEKLKSALLDAVTHDIRTPLTAIKASVTTLLDDARPTKPQARDGSSDGDDEAAIKLNTKARGEMLDIINEETDRLNHFVEGLIELARVEAGELALRRQWSAIDEVIAAALERASTLVSQHKIEIEMEKDLPLARVDARSVAEVIYTLIDNAAKYSPRASRIKIEARRDEFEMIKISVEDEGRGVPTDLRERVFDKFFRLVRDGDTNAPSGTGVGLAIAKGIVEAHGGRIWIEDATHHTGARFAFTLPIGDDEETT